METLANVFLVVHVLIRTLEKLSKTAIILDKRLWNETFEVMKYYLNREFEELELMKSCPLFTHVNAFLDK